jgi:hypothetical protein
MRWLIGLMICGIALVPAVHGAEGKVYKVLPQLLDKEGRHALTPSLYDRDAYQAYLRKHPAEISGLRFAVQWKTTGPRWEPLKLKVEMRGVSDGNVPKEAAVEMPVRGGGWFSHWESVKVDKAQYQALGEVTAWRVTLWEGDQLLSEQKSFLW